MRRIGTLLAVLATGCGAADAPDLHAPAAEPYDPLAALSAFEEEARLATDFAALPPAEQVTGANPIDLTALPGAGLYVAALGGADAIVVIDEHGIERQRLAAPHAPAALALAPDGAVVVAGATSPRLARYRRGAGGALVADGALDTRDALGVTDLAFGADGTLYLTEEVRGRVLAISPTGARELDRCHGPTRLAVAADHLAVDCLGDDEVRLYQLARGGATRVATIHHDGPIWAVAALRERDRVVLALAGVEDHPLDRSNGFGYVDSFVYLYAYEPQSGAIARHASVNVSEHGVVTPKWITLEATAGALRVEAAAYGSDARVELVFAGVDAPPAVTRASLPPGTTAMAGRLASNALLDAFVTASGQVVPVAGQPPRDPDAQVGELLFFTTLMAPWNTSTGMQSRFTCETCHYQGYGDGRVHYTGREDLHATTKPLRGLANNRPHFSRALDRNMTVMVHNEFNVANKGSGRSAWFALDAGVVPWLADVPGLPPGARSPLQLRRDLMTFLMAFTHAENPAAQGRASFTDTEARGARRFRQRCEGCHEARLVADLPLSRVPFGRWEALVLSPAGPIVWASERYEQTGVEPYVHALGARVPSLRRLYKKHPYFTNGSALSLPDLLARARLDGDSALAHEGEGTPLSASEREDLLAFLLLL